MSEFEEKLNAILSSPEAMAQVASLAQSLGLASSPEQGKSPPPHSAPEQQEEQGQQHTPKSEHTPAGSGGPDLSALLGQLDPALLSRFLPLLGELSAPQHSEQAQLLYALRPFLRESRRAKIDQALQVARILHLGRKFLGTLGDS